jgi:predicted O-methyltransferase YrrM
MTKRRVDLLVTTHVLPQGQDFDNAWAVRFRDLFETIEKVLSDGGTWCTLEKAHTLAGLIIGLRPQWVVEIGVWSGGSFVPMALALKALGQGRAIAIDSWKAHESIAGQGRVNADWWGQQDHEAIYQHFMKRLESLELHNFVDVYRASSNDAPVPQVIDLLHVDGNHGEQAFRDVHRFAPSVRVGGVCILDDIGWEGGHVTRAEELLVDSIDHKFIRLYPLETGVVYQRVG